MRGVGVIICLVGFMVGRSRKQPRVVVVDHEMDPLPEQENLLNYKIQGGLELDQVTDWWRWWLFFADI